MIAQDLTQVLGVCPSYVQVTEKSGQFYPQILKIISIATKEGTENGKKSQDGIREILLRCEIRT